MSLTGKQKAFVAAYLGEANFVASRAAQLAGYRANGRHSFESLGAENLKRPSVAAVIDEHFRAANVNAQEVLIELGKLARGSSKDKIKALSLLGAHHGLWDHSWQASQMEKEIEERAEILAQARLDEALADVQKDVDEYNRKAIENNERKDKQWKAIVERYKHSPEAVEALELMFRVMKDLEDIEPYEEPPVPKPEPVEVEIIPPPRRLNPAPIETMMRTIEPEIVEPLPQERCEHGYLKFECRVTQYGGGLDGLCPHHYTFAHAQSGRRAFLS